MTKNIRHALILAAAAYTAACTASAATVAPIGSRRAGHRIAAGSSHACTVRATGEVRCWGNNDFGQIGDNSFNERLTPVQVTNLNNAIAITPPGTTTLARSAPTAVSVAGAGTPPGKWATTASRTGSLR